MPHEIIDKESVSNYLKRLQQKICRALEETGETARFVPDAWQREGDGGLGGGGISCVLQDGTVFEQAGVNFSHVSGKQLPGSASTHRPELTGRAFEAMGLSIVIHPQNPYLPTSHANVRFFIAEHEDADPVWWFGGGFDLTPYYGNEEDCHHWHQSARAICEPFGSDLYPHLKQQCDDYFYLKHRQEPRGIGGLFFDDLNAWGFERCFQFMQSVATVISRPICPSSNGAKPLNMDRGSGIFSSTGAAAMWSSTCSTTEAPCSDCSRADEPNRS